MRYRDTITTTRKKWNTQCLLELVAWCGGLLVGEEMCAHCERGRQMLGLAAALLLLLCSALSHLSRTGHASSLPWPPKDSLLAPPSTHASPSFPRSVQSDVAFHWRWSQLPARICTS